MGRLLKLLGLTFLVSTVASMIGAVVARRHLVPSGTAGSDEVDIVAIFQPSVLVSHAKAFRGGTAICWMGGMDLDLRGATLDPDGADLYVRLIWGGGRIFVPEDWEVQLDLLAIMGGAADVRQHVERAPDAPTLRIDGFALMGGFAIMSERGANEPEPVSTFPDGPVEVDAAAQPEGAKSTPAIKPAGKPVDASPEPVIAEPEAEPSPA